MLTFPQLVGQLGILLHGPLRWSAFVEDVLFELSQGLLVLLPLQPLVLPEVHSVGEDQAHTLAVVLAVVMLVCDASDALQLVGVPCSYEYIVRVFIAVPFSSDKLPDATEEDLVEDNRVVGAPVKLSDLAVFINPFREEAVDGATSIPVIA